MYSCPGGWSYGRCQPVTWAEDPITPQKTGTNNQNACKPEIVFDDPNRNCRNFDHPDLYRSGNAQGPKVGIENMRFGKEISDSGMAIPNKGLSTFEEIKGSGRWWKFPAGAPLPQNLCLVNDHGDHWQIEPRYQMSAAEYGAATNSTRPWWMDMGNVK